MTGLGTFFVRVGEPDQAVELHFIDEVHEFVEVVLCFARETRDDGGANGEVGDAVAQFGDEFADAVLGGAAVHGF